MNAAAICNLLGIPFVVQAPRAEYMHGWGTDCAGARPIKCTWEITVMDAANWPVSLIFDLVEGKSPIILGMDIKRFSDTCNRTTPTTIKFKRPEDVRVYTMHTYIAKDQMGCERLRLELVPHQKSTMTTMMSASDRNRELHMAKRIHRFGHASASDMIELMKPTGYDVDKIREACNRVYSACAICAASGRPADRKKVSTTHINSAFNQELQSDFCYAYIRGKKCEILNMLDIGTRYGERVLTTSRSADEIKRSFETHWFYRHGAPVNFSADQEFCKPVLKRFLDQHGIKLNARPSRASNKTGPVERNNGVFKMILDRLQKADARPTSEVLIARASFMTNLTRGSRVMNAFQLARGYAPSVVGIPKQIISEELLHAHVERESTRALERLMRAKDPQTLDQTQLPTGTDVFVYHHSSKHCEPNEWIPATVINAEKHIVICRRRNKGPPMKVSYNDVRLMPRGPLTQELMQLDLMDEQCEDDLNDLNRATIPKPDRADEANRITQIAACIPSNLNEPNDRTADAGQRNDEITYDVSPTEEQHPTPELNVGQDLTDRSATMTATTRTGCNDEQEKDIGDTDMEDSQFIGDLESDQQKVLRNVHGMIGGRQVMLNELECAPSWLTGKALEKEHEENWADAYYEVSEDTLPANANIIGSHVVYKVKTSEQGEHRMKARICPHGNHDDQKNDIRKDSATAQFDIIRFMLALVTFLPMELGAVDISGAYMQSGPIRRDLYVRPPREWGHRRGFVWKLLKMPYGVSEAGRQWAIVFEEWLTQDIGMETVKGISQLFLKRRPDGSILMMVAKVTDDLLIAADKEVLNEFVEQVRKRFKVSKSITNGTILFNGARIDRNEMGDISMTMQPFMESLKPIDMARSRRKQASDKATSREYQDYRSMAGSLIWAGNATLPQASYVASYMQQTAPKLRVHHVTEANKMLKELKDLNATITFKMMKKPAKRIEVWTFSDASFNIVAGRDYGQTGVVTGLKAYNDNGESVFHVIDWVSSKQRRITHSSYGAEILACSDGDDRGFYFKQAINSVSKRNDVIHVLHVDSRGLYDTISTLHDGKEYRLRQTVQRIRDSFESSDIDILRWIPSGQNIADTLTKRCPEIQRKFNRQCVTGNLTLSDYRMKQLVSKEWK